MSVSTRPSPVVPATFAHRLWRAALVVEAAWFACLTAGAVVGVLGRLAMLLLTLAGGTSGSFVLLRFTLAGTLRIIVVPMLLGLPFALLVAALWPRLPGATALAKAAAAGLITFVFPGLLLLTDSSFKLNQVNRTFGMALFAVLYFVSGFLLGLAVDSWNRMAARRGWHAAVGPALWRWLLWAFVFIFLVVIGVWAHGEAFG